MSTITELRKDYPSQTNNFIGMIQDAWYNFVVNNYYAFINLTEATFNSLCKLFCDTLKPMILNLAREYAEELKEQRRQNLNIDPRIFNPYRFWNIYY